MGVAGVASRGLSSQAVKAAAWKIVRAQAVGSRAEANVQSNQSGRSADREGDTRREGRSRRSRRRRGEREGGERENGIREVNVYDAYARASARERERAGKREGEDKGKRTLKMRKVCER